MRLKPMSYGISPNVFSLLQAVIRAGDIELAAVGNGRRGRLVGSPVVAVSDDRLLRLHQQLHGKG